jgi:hypothetical protein
MLMDGDVALVVTHPLALTVITASGNATAGLTVGAGSAGTPLADETLAPSITSAADANSTDAAAS